jgi:hypothetical protein
MKAYFSLKEAKKIVEIIILYIIYSTLFIKFMGLDF